MNGDAPRIRSMSFVVELLLFMATMLMYVMAVSMYTVVLLWEYLGLLSFVLIQHWGARSMATLSSVKGMLYNKTLDVMVLIVSCGAPHVGPYCTRLDSLKRSSWNSPA